MYNKPVLITFKTYFMVMQVFMEVNCNIANFLRVHWARGGKVWLHSDDLNEKYILQQEVKKYFPINLEGESFPVRPILYYDN